MRKTVENVRNSKLVVLYRWVTRNKSKKITKTATTPTKQATRNWVQDKYEDYPKFWYGENETN